MKNLIFTISFILCFYLVENCYSYRDIMMNSNVPVSISIKLISVPFEGLNRIESNQNGRNRIGIIQNGFLHRRYFYDEYTFNDYPIIYSSQDSQLNVASCFAEVFTIFPAYGFGKYLVIFENINHPEKSVKFYWNTLDSKAGTNNILGRDYRADWTFFYYGDDNNPRVEISSNGVGYQKTIYPGNGIEEITIWYAFYNRQDPVEKNFYARTTPFPISPKAIEDFTKRDYILGTKVILDSVLQNFGDTDRNGYNTIDIDSYHHYYTNPPIPTTEYYDPGNTYTTPAFYYPISEPPYFVWGMKLILEPNDTLILRRNKKLWICGYIYTEGGDTIILRQGSSDSMGINSSIRTFNGGVLIDSGGSTVWSSQSHYRAFLNSSISFMGTNHIVNNGGYIKIDADAKLNIGNNTTLTFDGTNSYLKLDSLSKVYLGTNAKIKFTNGAYLDANGATFSSLGSSDWSGIEFENSGSTSNASTISNCTFNNAITPININNSGSSANNAILISGNTFNMSTSNNKCINAGNVNNFNISNNNFNMSVSNNTGIYIQISGTVSAAGTSEINSYNLNVTGNTFSGGAHGMILMCNANLIPFYIYGNIFNNNSSFNILARSISGNIKNNSSNNYNVEHSLFLVQSNPNVYGNTFYSSQSNLFLDLGSYPRLSPLIKSDAASWVGGMNTLNSSNDNIQFSSASYAFLDRGMNLFSKPNPSTYYHLYGDVHVWEREYYVRDNCFNGQYIPRYDLWEDSNIVTPVYEGSTFNCNASTDNGIGWEVSDKGFGIIDSVLITNPPSGVQLTLDEVLYTQASNQRINGYYLNAISAYKSLIDSYTNSINIYPALSELYECYQGLDTSSEQNNRNILYGNLLTYLNNKISSGLYDLSFVDIAYNLTLMCYTNMTEYTEAKDGYEFLSIYHPDPSARLYASLDYAIIEALLNSGSSISSKEENLPDETFLEQRINRLEELISGDPVKQILKKTYNLKKEEKERNLNKEIEKKSSDKETARKMIDKIKTEENNINSRALSSIRSLNKMNTKDKEKKKLEDILYAAKFSSYRTNRDNSVENIIPSKFDISQNYPNPFNPVTKINYDLPKSGLVKLMVYDILGREIKTLVNEFRQAGKYTVEFDGNNFASGVYFYRIESGDFTAVKRMLMIK